MKTYSPELFKALKESLTEKLHERLAVAITEYVAALEESLDSIVVDELRNFWKKSENSDDSAA